MARTVVLRDLDLVGGIPRPESEAYPFRKSRPPSPAPAPATATPAAASPIRHATNGMLPRERAWSLCFACSAAVKIIMPATELPPVDSPESDDPLPPPHEPPGSVPCPWISLSPKGRSRDCFHLKITSCVGCLYLMVLVSRNVMKWCLVVVTQTLRVRGVCLVNCVQIWSQSRTIFKTPWTSLYRRE
jgi:hypothetical protein